MNILSGTKTTVKVVNMDYIQVLIDIPGLRYAFVGALLVGLIAPLIGSFALTKRLALIPDTLAHVSLSGISFFWYLTGIGIVSWQVNMSVVAIVSTLIGATAIVILRNVYKENHDIPIAILLSTALGFTAIFISKAKIVSDLQSYLFASVVLISQSDLIVLIIVSIGTTAFVVLNYSKLLAYAFDEEYIHVLGINKKYFDVLFFLTLAVVVSFAIKVVGVMLISGLMTLPVATALKSAKSFKQVIVHAIIYAEIAIVSGMFSSYYFNLPVSGAIILVLVIIFICQRLISLRRLKWRK